MSQAKVDRHEYEKKNRKKLMRQEKIRTRLTATAVIVVLAALIGWFGWAVYGKVTSSAGTEAASNTTYLNLGGVSEYMNELSEYASNLNSDSAEETETVATSTEEVAATSAE